jgi:hypothetical protein
MPLAKPQAAFSAEDLIPSVAQVLYAMACGTKEINVRLMGCMCAHF